MTETEWLACTDPRAMLEFIQSKMSDRKLRLFAVACGRRIWEAMLDARSQRAIEMAERSADEPISWEELAGSSDEAERAYGEHLFQADDSQLDAFNAASCISTPGRGYWGQLSSILEGICRASFAGPEIERAAQTSHLRDIVGNPFRPATVEPDWRTRTVLSLAQACYEWRDLPGGTFDPIRLAILADALEDAGCTDARTLGHCRSGGEHVRGCWVVDLLLGKE